MCNQGIFLHYEGITSIFAKLSLDEQKDIAHVIQDVINAKIHKPTNSTDEGTIKIPEEIKEKIKKLAEEKLELEEKEKQYNTSILKLQNEIEACQEVCVSW